MLFTSGGPNSTKSKPAEGSGQERTEATVPHLFARTVQCAVCDAIGVERAKPQVVADGHGSCRSGVRGSGRSSPEFGDGHRLWIDRVGNPTARTPEVLGLRRRAAARGLFLDHTGSDQAIADEPDVVRRKLFELYVTERLRRVGA